MGLRFIRKASDTPNVGNSDDARMIRYAYANQNGYIEDKGSECGYAISADKREFTVTSGTLNLQGYEAEIDSNGITFKIDNISSYTYYSVYMEVNLAIQEIELKILSSSNSYPTIEIGDNLTANNIGISRLELYKFIAIKGIILDQTIKKSVKAIQYAYASNTETQDKEDASNKVASTKFVKSAIENAKNIIVGGFDAVSGFTAQSEFFKRQFDFVLLDNEFYLFAESHYLADFTLEQPRTFFNFKIGTLLNGFLPKEDKKYNVLLSKENYIGTIVFKTDGEILFSSNQKELPAGNYKIVFGTVEAISEFPFIKYTSFPTIGYANKNT